MDFKGLARLRCHPLAIDEAFPDEKGFVFQLEKSKLMSISSFVRGIPYSREERYAPLRIVVIRAKALVS